MGAATGYSWQWKITVCEYNVMYHSLGVQKEVATGAHKTVDLHDADKGAMMAEGQATLEPPGNPGYMSMDFCTCDTGYRVHLGRVDETSKDIKE